MPYPYTGFYNNPYATPQMPAVPQMPYGQPNTQPIMNNGIQPQMTPPQATQQVVSGNKIYVTNLQDALSRFASPNTTISYTTQDEKYVIDVFTDGQGKKTYQVFERTPYTPNEEKAPLEQQATNNFVTKDDFVGLEKRLDEKLVEFRKNIHMPDMTGYVTTKDMETMKTDLTRSFRDEIKSRMTQSGGRNNNA